MVIDDDGTDVDYLNDGWECVNEDGKRRSKNTSACEFQKKVINQTNTRKEMKEWTDDR